MCLNFQGSLPWRQVGLILILLYPLVFCMYTESIVLITKAMESAALIERKMASTHYWHNVPTFMVLIHEDKWVSSSSYAASLPMYYPAVISLILIPTFPR